MNTQETFLMREGEQSYRMLQVGEILESGDQWKFLGEWKDVVLWQHPQVITNPDLGAGFPQGYYRRPIPNLMAQMIGRGIRE